MKNGYPVKGKTAYRMSVALRTESAILGSGCGGPGALEKHLPGIFIWNFWLMVPFGLPHGTFCWLPLYFLIPFGLWSVRDFCYML